MYMRAYERLLNYVKIDSPSNPAGESVPSSACQFDLAKVLVEELKTIGIENAEVDDKCYVYASIPATEGYEICKKLGFDSLGYQSLNGVLEAIGIDPEKVCTYCWTGQE